MMAEVSERGKQTWLESVKREFQNGPLASNVVFGFIMSVLERLVETEFECPCEGTHMNRGFVTTFFIIPGILAFVLMVSVQGLKCSCDKDSVKRFFHCLFPAFVWMILLVVDGRYIACGMTKWKGRYVTADKAAPLKWCEPENGTLYEDRLKKSQDWYFHSQWAGLGLVLVLPFVWALVSPLAQAFVWAKDWITERICPIFVSGKDWITERICPIFVSGKDWITERMCPKQQQTNPPAQSQPGAHASPDETSGSDSAVTLQPCSTNTPDTNPLISE